MYDIFGEFDSAEEINATAAGLMEEGDIENIKALAAENGLDDMEEVYITGAMDHLTDPFMAAIGKLNVEVKEKTIAELKKKIPAAPVVNFLQSRADDPQIAAAIRKKGKSLKECLNYILKEAEKKVTREEPYLADMTVFLMALDYYTK